MIEKYINDFNLPYGIDVIDILFLLVLILILVNIIGSFNRSRLSNKINSIPGLSVNRNIISDIFEIQQKINDFSVVHNSLNSEILSIKKRNRDILDIKSLKYNPYQDMGVGGNQSFSTAMIDKNGNGIIITNLYSRERTRILLKEVKNFIPNQELAPEEKEVLEEIKKET